MQLQGKVALVTGAASGIGRSTAALFAEEGARVVLADLNEADGQAAARTIEDSGGEALFVPMDVTKEASVRDGVAQAAQRFGTIDVLFNNAGILGPQSVLKLHEVPEEEWDRMMNVNLKGVYLVAKHVIQEMLKAGGGVIVNTASISGMVGMTRQGAYAATKGAVIMLTRQMAIDYAADNIRVNAVAPGFVRTPMTEGMRADDPDSLFDTIAARVPMGRVAVPQDIAKAVLWLASDASAYVTGTTVTVDGGFTSQ